MVYIIAVLISLEIVQLLVRGVNQPACTVRTKAGLCKNK